MPDANTGPARPPTIPPSPAPPPRSLSEAFLDQRFDVERSRLYYAARGETLRKQSLAVQSVELAGALSAFAAFWMHWPGVGKFVAAVAALASGLGLAVALADERSRCLKAQAAFGDVFKLLPVVPEEETPERLRAVVEARAEAEKGDRPNLECLNVRCYNETCDILGMPWGKKRLTPFQATFGQIFRIPYRERRDASAMA